MSSGRSRSGGITIGNTDRRKYRVLAVLPRRHRRLQVAVGRGDHAHVDVQRRRAADALEGLLLERAQDLRLQRQRQIADFVEEQRAAMRQLELARTCAATAPVNAPFSWPKSSVSSSVSGIAAQLIATNGPSLRALSACSARAKSSLPVPLSPSSSTVVSVAAARCSATDTCFSFGVVADDLRRAAPLRQLLAQDQVLGRQPPLRERALHHQQQMIGIDRLGEEVERAFLHRRDRVLDAAERGHHDDRQLRIDVLRRAQHAEAVAFGQPQIGQHDAGWLAASAASASG